MFVHVIGIYIHVENSINRIRCMRMLCMPFIILIEYCFSQFHICILFCIFCIRISNWMCAVFCAFIWCWPFCFKVLQSHCFGCIAVAIKKNLYSSNKKKSIDTSKTMPFNQNYKLYNKALHRKSFSNCVCLQLKISQYTQCTNPWNLFYLKHCLHWNTMQRESFSFLRFYF